MGKDVFQSDDLCMISHQMKEGIKALNKKYELLKETAESSEDIKDKELISSMRSEMIENKALLDKHISIVNLRKLMNYDSEYEKLAFIKMSYALKVFNDSQLKKHMSINCNEAIVIRSYADNLCFEEIDQLMGWSEGTSFRCFVPAVYKIKRFFKKDLENILEKEFSLLTNYERKTIIDLKKYRDEELSKDIYKPRDIKFPKFIDGKKVAVNIKEEEVITYLKSSESYMSIADDMRWNSRYPQRYHQSAINKFIGFEELRKPTFYELLSEKERIVYDLSPKHKIEEISNISGIPVKTIEKIRKRLKDKKLQYN